MVRRSFVFAFSEKTSTMLLMIVTMAIVSRILTPAEVGLFLVASAIVVLIEAFRDFGVAAFIVREPELSPDLLRSAVTLIAILSLAFGAAVFAGSFAVAAFYGDPDLGALMRIASLAFLLSPVSNPLLALLRRDMAFGVVASIGIAAGLANSVTTVTLALAGFGAYSFAWGTVLGAIVMAVGAAVCRPQWTAFRPSLARWREVAAFGAWSSVVTLLGMAFDSLPRLILGRILGFGAVGLFSRAVSLTQLPDRLVLSAVQPVVLPAISARLRAGQSLKEPYLLGLSHISALHWPALAGLALLADPVVRLLLGQQWLEVVPLMRIVAMASFALFPVYLAYPVLVAAGRVRQMALVSLATLPPSMMILWGASHIGLSAVAWSLFLTGPLQTGAMLVLVRGTVDFRWRELGGIVLRSGAITAASAVVPAVLVAIHGPVLPAAQTVLAVAGGAAGWLIGLHLTRHPLFAEIASVAGLVRRRLAPRRAAAR